MPLKLQFVNPLNLNRITRYYSSKLFNPEKFKYGFMPAHPSFYTRKKFFDTLGYYKEDYKIAADYELLIRFLYNNKLKSSYIEKPFVTMRTGGVSTNSLKSNFILNKEIIRACRENGISTNIFYVYSKYFTKVFELFGNKMRIRVDANQGYSLENLKRFIQETKSLSIELIEQPMAVGKENELATLSETDRKLLTADETLIDAATALQLSHPPKPYGIFNIKLMKSGGIRGAHEIGIIAANAGIDLFWGCNDESMVSIAAALHVAYSCSNTKYLDLDGSFDLSSDLVTGGFILKDGYLYCSDQPGLGLLKI